MMAFRQVVLIFAAQLFAATGYRYRELSFVWQQKKQKCLAPVYSATCSRLMAKLKELAALRQLLILRHFHAAGARLRNRWRSKAELVFYFCSLAQRKNDGFKRVIR